MLCARATRLLRAPPLLGAGVVASSTSGVRGCKPDTRTKLDQQLQKLATRRVTTLWASGDVGAPGLFPASSAWATAVGGVRLADASPDAGLEAWSESGGGFDKAEARPDWQANATTAYIASATVTPTCACQLSPGHSA